MLQILQFVMLMGRILSMLVESNSNLLKQWENGELYSMVLLNVLRMEKWVKATFLLTLNDANIFVFFFCLFWIGNWSPFTHKYDLDIIQQTLWIQKRIQSQVARCWNGPRTLERKTGMVENEVNVLTDYFGTIKVLINSFWGYQTFLGDSWGFYLAVFQSCD